MSIEKFSASDDQPEEEVKKDEKKKSGIVRSLRKVAALGVLTGAVAGIGGEAFAGEKGKSGQPRQDDIESIRKRSNDAFNGMDDDMRDFDKEIKRVNLDKSKKFPEFRGKIVEQKSAADTLRSKSDKGFQELGKSVNTLDLFLNGSDFGKAMDALKQDVPIGTKTSYNGIEVTRRKDGKIYFGNNEIDQALWVKIKDVYKKITGQIKVQNKGMVDFK